MTLQKSGFPNFLKIRSLDFSDFLHEVSGHAHLGGEDFDNRVINYLVAEFKKDQGIDLQTDPLALQRVKETRFEENSPHF